MIYVTKTYLPQLEDYVGYLKKIWSSHWLTNNGQLVRELERKLKRYLGVKHLFLVSNGTIALQLAIKALGLKKEIITTPFSYVASTSSIVWEGCKPKFVDIDPQTLCLDVTKIEKAITPKTEAILAVHVYGNPCDIEKIKSIAKRYGLKVIYDAAHAFGVRYDDKSIMTYGDISTVSFHATKIFHTAEGGAVMTNDDKLAHRLSYLRDFGHDGSERFFGLGLNGKNSEFHAALGLCILPEVRGFITRRKKICEMYSTLLKNSPLRMPSVNPRAKSNFAYYPVIFPSEKLLLKTRKHLNEHHIYPRRYFYPSLNTLSYVEPVAMKVSEDISRRVLCLPLYHDLRDHEVRNIVNLILEMMLVSE